MLKVAALCVLLAAGVTAVRDSFQWFRANGECREVMTEAGTVRGCIGNGEEHITFLGVPYAAPPVGPARFKPPIRPYSWRGIFDADRIVKCPQFDGGLEDCLVVNIFAPAQLYDGPIPVLVYFHGGSFLLGSGQVYGTHQLVRQNIVVVTVNYRLGALGFLCLGTDTVPGNAGLKDQLAALQWIQRNINNFGGDPNQVTIYGMSAGGASVEFLVLSDQVKGLFQRAIVESGSATSIWAIDPNPVVTAMKVAEKLKLPMNNVNSNLLATFFQRVNPVSLSQATYNYYNSLVDGYFGFAPCIEKPSNNSRAFLTESPREILLKGKYNQVPMMFLFSTLEGLYLRSAEYYEQNYKEKMTAKFLDFVPGDLEFDSPEIKSTIADNIKKFYFSNNASIGEDLKEYLDYFGDYQVMNPLLNSAELHSRNDNPVYLMEFAYKGKMGSQDKFYDSLNFAGHGDVIKHAILNKQPRGMDDKAVVARVVKLITNFVKFGNPIPERTHILPILWPTIQPGNVSSIYLDRDIRVVDDPHWDRKEFWDALYATYRKELLPVDPTIPSIPSQ